MLVAEAQELKRLDRTLELTHMHTETPEPLAEQLVKNFRIVNLFVGHNYRKKMNYDSVDYLPCFLSEIPALFRTGRVKLDVALIQVSPPAP
jgi:acyl-CoA hydrolase